MGRHSYLTLPWVSMHVQYPCADGPSRAGLGLSGLLWLSFAFLYRIRPPNTVTLASAPDVCAHVRLGELVLFT